jgi:hypothetical protein
MWKWSKSRRMSYVGCVKGVKLESDGRTGNEERGHGFCYEAEGSQSDDSHQSL